MAEAKYIIGIDLGTTNCTMSYAPIPSSKKEESVIKILGVEQMVGQGAIGKKKSLPSFLYFPLEEELQSKLYQLPWNEQSPFVVGVAARERGGGVPHRMVSSAKSWLCHDGIDRREKILPQAADEGIMSPLEACSELLVHLAKSWDQVQDAPFVEQKVLVTVPASFDPSARQLVEEATKLAGYGEIVLLEEPQAAFYSWLHRHAEDWREELEADDQVLVVDIGGGTTDFTLIQVVDDSGDLSLERVAVGSHLLLGGDNMDLGLAHLAKNKFEEQGHTIDD